MADVTPQLVADRNFRWLPTWPGTPPVPIVGDWRRPASSPDHRNCIMDGSLSSDIPDGSFALFHDLTCLLEKGGWYSALFPRCTKPYRRLTRFCPARSAISCLQNREHVACLATIDSANLRRRHPWILLVFVNREELVRWTGWSREQIDTIDFYKDSTVFFSLPRKDQLLPVVSSVYPDARLVPSGTYEMSELCPILVANNT
jgi:hypothetical protein